MITFFLPKPNSRLALSGRPLFKHLYVCYGSSLCENASRIFQSGKSKQSRPALSPLTEAIATLNSAITRCGGKYFSEDRFFRVFTQARSRARIRGMTKQPLNLGELAASPVHLLT